MAVVLHHPQRPGKRYRLPTEADLSAYRAAEEALVGARQRLAQEWGLDPVPDEPTPLGGGPGAERAFSVHKYGMTRWGDLFNPRQKLALITSYLAPRHFTDGRFRIHYLPMAPSVGIYPEHVCSPGITNGVGLCGTRTTISHIDRHV